MFHRFVYKLGVKFRNQSILKILSFLNQSDDWSIKELEAYQLERLNELIKHTYKYSLYYRNKWDKLGISINKLTSLEDIKKLPITEKRELLEFNKEIQSSYEFKDLKKSTTSGSSGESLQFYRDEWADSFNRASIFRAYNWYGVKPWELNGYFWGFNFSKKERLKTKILDWLQNRFRLFSYKSNEFEQFVKSLSKAKYLHGYSSMIYQTAKLINEKKLQKPKGLKMIKGTSEKIFDRYNDEVKKAFGMKIISEYGATESGIIAYECPGGNMHLNMEGVLVEEVNNEILVTNLQMKSFPIIRYRLGDYIELAPKEKKCPCGRNHYILKEITGRIGENIYGKAQIYPSLYFYYIFKNLVKTNRLKLNYQVIQNKKGYLIFNIEQSLTTEEIELLRNEIKKYFKTDMEFKILTEQNISSKNNKLKSFISNID